MVALIFDTAIIYAYVFTHAFSPGTSASRLLVLAVIEAAVRYGVAGAVWMTVANIPLLAAVEYDRAGSVNGFEIRNVTLTLGIQLIAGPRRRRPHPAAPRRVPAGGGPRGRGGTACATRSDVTPTGWRSRTAAPARWRRRST